MVYPAPLLPTGRVGAEQPDVGTRPVGGRITSVVLSPEDDAQSLSQPVATATAIAAEEKAAGPTVDRKYRLVYSKSHGTLQDPERRMPEPWPPAANRAITGGSSLLST